MNSWNQSDSGEQTFKNDYIGLFELIAASSSLILIFVFAFAGNGIILAIIIKQPRMRTVVNAFVASLSSSDLLISASVMSVTFAVVVTAGEGSWTPSETVCLLQNYLNSVSGICSTWTMAFIACDKYISVVYRSRWRISNIQAGVMISVTWFSAIFISIPWNVGRMLVGLTMEKMEKRFNPNTRFCYTFLNTTNTAETYRFVLVIALCYVTPLVIMACCFVVISSNVKSIRHRIRPVAISSKQILFQAEMRTATTVLVMLSIYALCWLPYIIVSVVSFFSNAPIPETVHTVTLWVTWLDKAINPSIYAVRNKTVSRCIKVHNFGHRTKIKRYRDYIASDNDRRISYTAESCLHPTSSITFNSRSSIDSNLFLTSFSYDKQC